MSPHRRSDAERNRRRIIEAGIEVLSADPEANIGEVAEASGVGRTTLYRHFDTRDELVDAILEEMIERSRRQAAATDPDPEDPATAIRGLSRAHLDMALIFGSLIQARNGLSPVVESAKDTDQSPTKVFLDRARRAGTIRTDQPREWQQTVMQVVTLTAIDEVRAGEIGKDDAYEMVALTLSAILLPADG
ncbi:MAG: TetR/AcrR family transcriptional regulator [Solirubrobacterales bacterium]